MAVYAAAARYGASRFNFFQTIQRKIYDFVHILHGLVNSLLGVSAHHKGAHRNKKKNLVFHYMTIDLAAKVLIFLLFVLRNEEFCVPLRRFL